MGLESIVQLFLLATSSFVVAGSTVWLLAHLVPTVQKSKQLVDMAPDHTIAFLFADGLLLNATSRARLLFATGPEDLNDWQRFIGSVFSQYPDLKDQVSNLGKSGQFSFISTDGASSLDVDKKNGLVRISISDGFAAGDSIKLDKSKYHAMEQEIETLRTTAHTAPFLVWRQTKSGAITWANSTYLDLTEPVGLSGHVPTWPPKRIFELNNNSSPGSGNTPNRQKVLIKGEAEPRWFECFESHLENESLFTAIPADNVVKAEVALREFIQTLTKTFAHLKIGLAIFDKQRRLTLFNPALADLTTLSAGFLSGRPTFQAVLDQLRDKKMIPEPKDYKSWRKRLNELEVAAVNGTYEEVWSLANGQTFRVTGRPHPDGAVAYLFEDISSEVLLTRRIRADSKNSQAVIDSLEQAVAMFSPTGALLLSNTVYCGLWGMDPSTILGNFGILEATRVWSGKCYPTPVWGDAREFVGTPGDRAEWSADVQLNDGRTLSCRFTPMSGGASLISFSTPIQASSIKGCDAELVQKTKAKVLSM